MLKVHELVAIKKHPWYLLSDPSGYGSGDFSAVGNTDRDGLARGGQFAQGFGVIPEKLKPAALWCYNNVVEPEADDGKKIIFSVMPGPPTKKRLGTW